MSTTAKTNLQQSVGESFKSKFQSFISDCNPDNNYLTERKSTKIKDTAFLRQSETNTTHRLSLIQKQKT